MKRLFLMRHAKSSWDHPDLSDFERPLNRRGEKAAPRMGIEVVARGYEPEVIVCSPAERAQQTAKLFNQSTEFDCDIRLDSRIYAAAVNSLLYVVSEFEEDLKDVLMVGHNPGFEGLLDILTGKYRRMPTAAFAVIEIDTEDWNTIRPGTGRLFDFIVPRELS